MHKISFMPTSKMQLLLQSTSPAASFATRRRCNMPLRRWILSGFGLYLAPGDMTLHPGNVQGYNNNIEIVVRGSNPRLQPGNQRDGADRQDHRR